jgi:hypothetical protein
VAVRVEVVVPSATIVAGEAVRVEAAALAAAGDGDGAAGAGGAAVVGGDRLGAAVLVTKVWCRCLRR